MLPTRDPPQKKRHKETESKGLEKILQANGQEKKSGVTIRISDIRDFKTKAVKRDTEGHFIILKRRIHQEDKNMYKHK